MACFLFLQAANREYFEGCIHGVSYVLSGNSENVALTGFSVCDIEE